MGAALRLVGVEQRVAGRAGNDHRELPGEVGRIPDPGAHALPEKRGGLVGAVSGEHRSTATPRDRDQRVERVDGGTFDANVLRADGVGEHRPDSRRLHDLRFVVARHEHDLPPMPEPLHVHPGHRPARVAVLDRVVGEAPRPFRFRARGDIDDEPGLMEAEIQHRGADRVAHHRPCSVAADDVARRELARSAGREVPDGDRHVVTCVENPRRLVPEPDIDVRQARDPLAERRVELRLMEVPVGRPVVLPGAVGAAAHHEGPALGVDEVHALRRCPRDPLNRFGEPGGLEDPHDLAVEVDGPRQGMDSCVAFQHEHVKPVPAEEIGEQRADRAEADDDDVEVRVRHAASHPSVVRDPPTRPRAS